MAGQEKVQKLTVILLDQHDDPAFPHEGFYTMQELIASLVECRTMCAEKKNRAAELRKNGMQKLRRSAVRCRGASAKGKEEARRDDGK